jgi:glycosyltransferase involved in cell wall biosynthesis
VKVSVIICFYGQIAFLKFCLDALGSAGNDIDEVIIADDGSAADVVRQIGEFKTFYSFPIVHAWHQRQGPRRAATRNNGIRRSSGDYLIFIDADFLVLPGAIRSHLAKARHGQFVAGRCKYTTEEQTREICMEGVSEGLLEKIYMDLPDKPISREHREFISYGWLQRFGLVSPRKQTFGGHFSVFRTDIESINGYDENYIGWGGEDQDLALRFVTAGFRGASAIKKARALHMWHIRELEDKRWNEGPNVDYFFRRNIPVFCENGLVKLNKK